MDLETDYIEYGIQLSLSMAGVSLAYFIDVSRPETFLALMMIPVLYGYTAYISNEGFSRSSLMSLPALIFVLTGGFMAVVAAFYSIGNILVSLFSHGTQFKDFYGSTTLPLLLLGVMTGAGIFVYGSMNPGFQEDVAERVGGELGGTSAEVINQTGIVQDQKTAQYRLVNTTSRLSARLAMWKLMQDRGLDLDYDYRTEVQDNVTRQVYERTEKRFQSRDTDLSATLENTLTTKIKGLNLLLAIPIVAAVFYTLQPLIGVLTAIFGKMALFIDVRTGT